MKISEEKLRKIIQEELTSRQRSRLFAVAQNLVYRIQEYYDELNENPAVNEKAVWEKMYRAASKLVDRIEKDLPSMGTYSRTIGLKKSGEYY